LHHGYHRNDIAYRPDFLPLITAYGSIPYGSASL
jgi:hypothetical protein